MSQSTSQSSTIVAIVKSGYLWKKGMGVLGQTYKERLFELKSSGKLDYFEVLNNAKTLKGTIQLSSVAKIKRRSDDEHKFIIETKDRTWYLWCRDDKNDTKQTDEWCSLMKNIINPSKTQTEQKEENTDTFAEHKECDPSPEDIIISRRSLSPNEPFNPFYGTNISSSDAVDDTTASNNTYYASLNATNHNNNDIKHISNASAPPLDEYMENKSDDVLFSISERVSLKSSLFKSWISYDAQKGYLCAVTTAPMVNERFHFECIDKIKGIYSIQTSSGLYLSADTNGNVKFLTKKYGIYEEWIIKYHHINKMSITSSYYGTHFGIDSNASFHHKYPNITDIVLFQVSPPLILTQNETQKAIHEQHWNSLPLRPSVNNDIIWPKLIDGTLIALSCFGDNYVGVEDNTIRTNYTTFQSFDGEILTRSAFLVKQNKPHQLFAFECALNNKYISPSNAMNGKLRFVDKLSEKEYFDVVWHEVNVICLVSWNGTMVKIKNNTLYHEGSDVALKDCSFEIKSKERKKEYIAIPRVQLPVRCINGEIKRDIWLKGHSADIGYLAFRSKPYRFEAVSKMMGRWETLRFKHFIERNNLNKCIVSLYTENGMMIGCNDSAQIDIIKTEHININANDDGYRWGIYFHSYSLISIQNEKYKGWMMLKNNDKTQIYVLSMLNPSFDHNGKPIVDIKNARAFKNTFCQFQLCPIANCKDIQQSNSIDINYKTNSTQNTSVTFSM